MIYYRFTRLREVLGRGLEGPGECQNGPGRVLWSPAESPGGPGDAWGVPGGTGRYAQAQRLSTRRHEESAHSRAVLHPPTVHD